MAAALDDPAVFEHQDGLGVADRGKAVRTVRPYIKASMPCWTMASVRVSIDEVASSKIMTGGSATAARAMEISWHWPWERLLLSPLIWV